MELLWVIKRVIFNTNLPSKHIQTLTLTAIILLVLVCNALNRTIAMSK